MSAGPLRAVAVAALLALAGCTAPVADDPVPALESDEPTTAPTTATTATTDETADRPPEGVVVEGGSFETDVNRTYERVQRLLGAEYAGTRVVVRDLTAYKTADYSTVPFFRVFGVENPSLNESEPTGLTTLDGTVYVSPADASPARLEQVLAHEFVHVAQVREDMVPWFGALSLSRVSLDERLARRALVEGGAVFVADAYTDTHLDGVQRQADRIAALYANASAANRVVWAPYHFGHRYVNATVAATEDLAAVYEDAPTTTEAVLHPGELENRTALDVDVDAAEFERAQSRTVRVGELVARIALRDATNRSVAVNASAGWGNDRVVAFTGGGEFHVAWVTRWDTTGDAEEFAAAARELGEDGDTDDEADAAFRVDRVDNETVVVFAGSETFVDAADASGNVTVTA